jgi:hypothetical protein
MLYKEHYWEFRLVYNRPFKPRVGSTLAQAVLHQTRVREVTGLNVGRATETSNKDSRGIFNLTK